MDYNLNVKFVLMIIKKTIIIKIVIQNLSVVQKYNSQNRG